MKDNHSNTVTMLGSSSQGISTSRRKFISRSAAVGASSLSIPFISKIAQASSTVNVLAFGGYEEPGMLTEFEEKTGISVNLKIHDGSDEEMIALMQTSAPGTFDVITPTSAYIPKAIEDGIISELNPSDFPLDDYFNIIATWPPVWKSGKLYAVVNRFGYYGITYNHKSSLKLTCLRAIFYSTPQLKGEWLFRLVSAKYGMPIQIQRQQKPL